jgi:ketosteroid isomerase-like protein
MRRIHHALLLVAIVPGFARAQAATNPGRAGIEAFNRALTTATRNMNNAATMALWDSNGVSLLPSTNPIVGKAAIGQFLNDATKQLAGAKMESFDLRCFGIEVSGHLGSEWCVEHQVVAFPDNRPRFDGWGKLLLVLHQDSDGHWRLIREMWNQALPDSTTSPH